ncbi:hypothetical protein [Verrucomicrobium sp. GAS474]|uniref:hypothetical protein n=1 Tax=Verrucomicrobium sp. GAS474 TaxID=1882831 RepID=UPI0012FFC345|nr:hypothetical protein [Verrucomicrobium sp. GAS474]
MKSTILALCGTLLLFTSGTASAQRMTSPLTSGWKFIKADVPLTASTGDWEEISIPHTWNAMDGQLGKKGNPEVKGGYYRGIGWYERSLDIPADWKDKRVFIRFQAASLMHFGSANELRVQVDNSH